VPLPGYLKGLWVDGRVDVIQLRKSGQFTLGVPGRGAHLPRGHDQCYCSRRGAGGISVREGFMSNEKDDISELAACLLPGFQEDPRIAAAYLFGSRGTGNVGAQSDTDLAILVCPAEAESFSLQDELRMEAELSLVLRTDEVDVVILNRCPLPLAYKVIAEGKLLYEAEPIANMDFVESTLIQYFDFAPTLQDFYQEYDRSLREEFSRA